MSNYDELGNITNPLYKEIADLEAKLKTWDEELVKTKSELINARGEIVRLKEHLKFFVSQGVFPFGDFAQYCNIDLEECADRFHKAQEAIK